MTRITMEVLFAVYVLLALFNVNFCAKIVVLPAAGTSHVSQGSNIGNALAKNGHDVFMILPDKYRQMDKYKGGALKILTHHTPEKDTEEYDLGKMMKQMIGLSPGAAFGMGIPGLEENCRNVLSDQKLYNKLKDVKADLFVVDSFVLTQCVYVLPYSLGVPYASYGTAQIPEWARSPALPSFVPMKFGTPYTEKMTFLERIDNTYSALLWSWFPKPNSNEHNWVQQFAPEMPPITVHQLLLRSSLWLINNDIVIDYPRPFMPNEIYCGGLTTKPAKALPENLEKIANDAEHGVIIMSFGSGSPDLHSENFMRVFAKLKQVVLWRHMSEYNGDVPVPKNVHLLKWLPQNDLMGHNNTKLFITHGGSNGQFEGLYHGVPMLAFPIFAEQPFNAKRLVYHGFGKVLNIMTFTEGELELAIREIISDPSYSRKIKHASKIYRSRPETPADRVTMWVNHVLEYGDRHLKSYALEMPWYSYCMLDIFAFLIVATFVISMLTYKLFQRCCCRTSKRKIE